MTAVLHFYVPEINRMQGVEGFDRMLFISKDAENRLI